MLVQLSVTNYKNFKNENTLSLLASNYDKKTCEDSNVFYHEQQKLRLLKSSVIYGANSAGKTKLFDSLKFMRKFILSSSKDSQKGELIDIEPFLLSTETESAPTQLEVVFIQSNVLYRYGFEVDKEKVISEWLYYKPKNQEVEIFYRDEDGIDTHERKFTKANFLIKEGFLRDNSLLLSLTAQFNDKIAGEVVTWFKKLKVISGLREAEYKLFTMRKMKEDKFIRDKMLLMLKAADLGINDIEIDIMNIESIPSDMPNDLKNIVINKMTSQGVQFLTDPKTFHHKFDELNQKSGEAIFSMDKDESHGTQKFFYLSGPILHAIENGETLFIDELDSRLHTKLVQSIVSIFNDKDINKTNAQLIFNTHDSRLLNSDFLRRDQVWFIEKNLYGVSKLFSLSEFKSSDVRKGDNFESKYLDGKYGAVPYLKDFKKYLKNIGSFNETAI